MCGYLSMHTNIYRVALLDFVTSAGFSIYRATRHVYWNPLEPPPELIPPDQPAPVDLSSLAPFQHDAVETPAEVAAPALDPSSLSFFAEWSQARQ